MPSWLAVHGTLTSDRGARDRRDHADRRSAGRVTAHQSCATRQQRTAGGRDGVRDVKHGDEGCVRAGERCALLRGGRRTPEGARASELCGGGRRQRCHVPADAGLGDGCGRSGAGGWRGGRHRTGFPKAHARPRSSTTAGRRPVCEEWQSVRRPVCLRPRQAHGPPDKESANRCPLQIPSNAGRQSRPVRTQPCLFRRRRRLGAPSALQLHVSRAIRRLANTERLSCSRRSGMLARCRKMRGGRACRKRRAEPFAGSIVSAVPYLDICFQVFWISGLKIQ